MRARRAFPGCAKKYVLWLWKGLISLFDLSHGLRSQWHNAIFVQYIDYAFTYSKPEVLSVLASIPYYEDIYNAYPWPDWEPGSTYLGKSSGSSQTATGVTEFSLGGYVSIEQDISVLGLKIASIEMENSISANTSYEFSHTIERESTVQYETNGGQDSVVMVSAPLDV